MKIDLITIGDKGIPNKERLYLKVLSETSMNYFMVLSSVYIDSNSISRQPNYTYWFPPKIVKAGDHILLYTGVGLDAEFRHEDGAIVHAFYWGNTKTIWNTPADCAILMELNSWQTTKF